MLNKIKPKILNKKCFKVLRSYGSIIILDFGKKISYQSPKNQINYIGEFSLIVNTSDWILAKENNFLCDGNSQKDLIDKNITIIKNKKLIDINNSSIQTSFVFDDNIILQIPLDNQSEEYDLYTNDGHVLVVGPNHKFVYKKSNK